LSRPLVDFVVCTRNNRAIISSALEGIRRQTVQDFTCTLVDERSTDGTPELVRERFPWVDILVKESDGGPAVSRNVGLSRGSANFIVFVDSDVTLEPRWAEVQIALMNNPSIGIACGKLLWAATPEVLYAAYGSMNRYGVGWDGGRGHPAACFAEPRRCLWANTAAIAVRRELVERIGGFDGAMFAYYEDGDFGWRANLFGYQVVFNPAAVAVHLMHGTFTPETMSRRIIYLIWRNRLRTVLVNYEFGNLLRYTSVYLLFAILYALARGPRKEKFAALLWNATHVLDTLRRRRWVQAHRSVRDKELWPMFEPGIRGPGYGFFPRGVAIPGAAPDRSAVVRSPD
jgi:GT2 family glycosyltransferase